MAEVTLSRGFFEPPAPEAAVSVRWTVILPSRSMPLGTPYSWGLGSGAEAGWTVEAALRTISSPSSLSSFSSSSSPSVLCVLRSRFLAASRSASRPASC